MTTSSFPRSGVSTKPRALHVGWTRSKWDSPGLVRPVGDQSGLEISHTSYFPVEIRDVGRFEEAITGLPGGSVKPKIPVRCWEVGPLSLSISHHTSDTYIHTRHRGVFLRGANNICTYTPHKSGSGVWGVKGPSEPAARQQFTGILLHTAGSRQCARSAPPGWLQARA